MPVKKGTWGEAINRFAREKRGKKIRKIGTGPIAESSGPGRKAATAKQERAKRLRSKLSASMKKKAAGREPRGGYPFPSLPYRANVGMADPSGIVNASRYPAQQHKLSTRYRYKRRYAIDKAMNAPRIKREAEAEAKAKTSPSVGPGQASARAKQVGGLKPTKKQYYSYLGETGADTKSGTRGVSELELSYRRHAVPRNARKKWRRGSLKKGG